MKLHKHKRLLYSINISIIMNNRLSMQISKSYTQQPFEAKIDKNKLKTVINDLPLY